MEKRPQIKFYKDAAPDILAGRKTLEPRPRSPRWIGHIAQAGLVDLTYGPRMGSPTIFATAEIVKVETRPFDTATEQDLQQIGLGWQNRTVEEFVQEYTKWYKAQLEKGYPVAWIYFQLAPQE